MKKKMIVLLAAALLTLGAAGSALASFGDQQLEMFAYNGSSEVAINLGAADLTSLDSFKASLGLLAGNITTGASAVSALGGTIYAGILGVDFANTGNVAISGAPGNSAITASDTQYGNATAAMNMINNYYKTISPVANVVTAGRAALDSYYVHMDSSGPGLGNFGSLVPLTTHGDATTTLAAAVTQELYYLDSNNNWPNFVDTGYKATINTDGSVTIAQTTAATPIPAAIYLMGSGLLGMVGLRRRKNA